MAMDHAGEQSTAHPLHAHVARLGEREAHVARHVENRTHISRDVAKEYSERRTLGQRLADRVARFGGSWTFITLFGAVMTVWVVLNSFLLTRIGKPYDPFPYILLNLFLSMLAAVQAPVILMSQNRQAHKDRMTAEHDYEVNLKAELEIMALHEKVDSLRQHQWDELIVLQREQLRILTEMQDEMRRSRAA
jgi:uncharacterized membrane protein